MLDLTETYCDKWKLKVNVNKTKVIRFSNGKQKTQTKPLLYKGTAIDSVDSFKYLGILMNYNGNYHKAKKELHDQANKAMFSLLTKSQVLELPIDIQLDLFEKTVVPILLYGSEVWGFENMKIVETLHLRFCKYILKLKRSTPSYMVYGELGVYSMRIYVAMRMVTYWTKLIDNSCKLSSKVYNILHQLSETNVMKVPWIEQIKGVFNSCGLSNIWAAQSYPNAKWLTASVKQKLKDQFIQEWQTEIDKSSKAIRLFNGSIAIKKSFCMETYLNILPKSFGITLCKFRTCNHKLAIERQRYHQIERHHRFCDMCDKDVIGDEFHFLF